MKKKFSLIAYLLVMAMFILPMSGCDDDDDETTARKKARVDAANRVLVISSDAFKDGEEYNLYTGEFTLTGVDGNPRYYVAPSQGDAVVLQLEFDSDVSNDTGFLITEEGSTNVVFAYNPNGTGNDTSSANVTGLASASAGHKTSYSGLELSDALTVSSIQASDIGLTSGTIASAKSIVLSSAGTATIDGSTVPAYNGLVWHVSPDHAGEYWTYNGTEYYDEDEAKTAAGITADVYIAKDIRYVPDYLEFSTTTVTKANGTDEGDNDKLYVAYYNKGASTDITEDGKYILAAIPADEAMGGPGGGRTGGPDGSMEGGRGGPEGGTRTSATSSVIDQMKHSVSEAAENPVLHINAEGTYKLSGTWNGQIWIDPGKKKKVTLILDGVTVKCTVAPALVFYKVYECDDAYDDDDETELAEHKAWIKAHSMDIDAMLMGEDEGDEVEIPAGAVVCINNGTTNTFTGTNVARLNKVNVNTDDEYTTTEVGRYVKAQKKMYKLDGAFHSRRSMIIGLVNEGTTGTLTINSDYEGLDSEMHMLIDSGTIVVNADDDGINVNNDDLSVFHMNGGSLTVNATNGDGIDSNGYIVITSADKLSITAKGATKPSSISNLNASAEGALDADCGVYMSEEVFAIYEVNASSSSTGGSETTKTGGDTEETDIESVETHTDTITRSDGTEAGVVNFKTTTIQKATYTPEERVEHGVAESGNVFKVYGTVNDFSGIK